MFTNLETPMTEEKQRAPLSIPIDIAQKAVEPPAAGENKIEFRRLFLLLWQVQSPGEYQPADSPQSDHCHHRTFRLW